MKIYAYKQEKWDRELKKPRLIKDAATVNEYSDVIVEPIRKIKGKNKLYEGGVCDIQGNFIAGFRSSFDIPNSVRSCVRSYKVDLETATHFDEDVIFGGVLCEHFGHLLSDSSARLWYFPEHPEDKRKVVFITNPFNAVISPGDIHYKYLEFLGINQERVIIADEPMRFRSILVPDQVLYPQGKVKFRKELKIVHRALYKAVEPAQYEKIYLTRSAFKDKNPIIGEDYYEKIFNDLGYKSIAPELYPFEEQLAFVAGAKSIACTAGTLSLISSFSPYAQEIIALKRSYEFRPGLISQGLWFDHEMYLIDANINFLPEVQGNGAFLLGDNPQWQRFLDERPDMKKVADQYTYDIERNAWEYVKLWTSYSMTPSVIRAQRNITYADFIKRLTFVLKGKEADVSRIEQYWEYSPIVQESEEAEKTLKMLLKDNNFTKKPASRTHAYVCYEGSLCKIIGTVDLPFVDQSLLKASYKIDGLERDEFISFEWKWTKDALEWQLSFDVVTFLDACAHDLSLCREILQTIRIAISSPSNTVELQPIVEKEDAGFALSLDLKGRDGLYMLASGEGGVLSINRYRSAHLNKFLSSSVVTSVHRDGKDLTLEGSFELTCYSNEDIEMYISFSPSGEELRYLDHSLNFPVSVKRDHSRIIQWEARMNLEKIHEFSFGNNKGLLVCGLAVNLGGAIYAAKLRIVSAAALCELKSSSIPFEDTILCLSLNKDNEIYFAHKSIDKLLQKTARTYVNRFGTFDDGFKIAGWLKSYLCVARGFALSLSLVGDEVSIDVPLSFETDYSKGYFTRWEGVVDCKEFLQNYSPAGDLVFYLKISCEKGSLKAPLGSPCSDGARIAISAASCLDNAISFFNRLNVGFGLSIKDESLSDG